MESYCSLCTFIIKVPQGANNLILCTLDTIHRLFVVTRLIINKINKVQWVDFKLENVLVSLHSLNVLVMEIGWTDVGSGGYILVSCAHSNTSFELRYRYINGSYFFKPMHPQYS